MHKSRCLLATVTVLTVLARATPLSAQSSAEAKGNEPIASVGAPAEAPGETCISRPDVLDDEAERPCQVEPRKLEPQHPPGPDISRDTEPGASPEDRILQFEAEMRGQDIDPSWSAKAVERIEKAVEDALAGLATAEAGSVFVLPPNCKKSLCRVAFTSTNAEAMGSFIQEFQSRLGWTGAAQTYQTDTFMTAIYLSRED
jgi:hypothetical protein